jgi:hypothetical protein
MNKYLFFLAFVSLFCRSAGYRPVTQPQPIAAPQPILVLMEEEQWLNMDVIRHSPTFVLYDDGTMIYIRQEPTPEEPFQSRKVPDATGSFKALLAFDPGAMRSEYRFDFEEHAITTTIWTPTKKIRILGDWRKMLRIDSLLRRIEDNPDTNRKADAEGERREWQWEYRAWKSLPNNIRTALLRIDSERSFAGRAWLPPAIEVVFEPYINAPDTSIIWPKEWPGLQSKDTREWKDTVTWGDGGYCVFLPSGKLAELRSFLATRKDRGAVLIDGKKMSVGFKLPLPGEEAWGG